MNQLRQGLDTLIQRVDFLICTIALVAFAKRKYFSSFPWLIPKANSLSD